MGTCRLRNIKFKKCDKMSGNTGWLKVCVHWLSHQYLSPYHDEGLEQLYWLIRWEFRKNCANESPLRSKFMAKMWWVAWKNRWDRSNVLCQIRPKFRLEQNLPWSAHHFCLQLADDSTCLWQSIINDTTDEWYKRLRACICDKGRYFKHLMRMFTFFNQKKNQVISSKTLVWSPRD